tara:strand:+ start:5132 stop:5317 length:186 start_codon:yes stop_codon:yes gene_type:complete
MKAQRPSPLGRPMVVGQLKHQEILDKARAINWSDVTFIPIVVSKNVLVFLIDWSVSYIITN